MNEKYKKFLEEKDSNEYMELFEKYRIPKLDPKILYFPKDNQIWIDNQLFFVIFKETYIQLMYSNIYREKDIISIKSKLISLSDLPRMHTIDITKNIKITTLYLDESDKYVEITDIMNCNLHFSRGLLNNIRFHERYLLDTIHSYPNLSVYQELSQTILFNVTIIQSDIGLNIDMMLNRDIDGYYFKIRSTNTSVLEYLQKNIKGFRLIFNKDYLEARLD